MKIICIYVLPRLEHILGHGLYLALSLSCDLVVLEASLYTTFMETTGATDGISELIGGSETIIRTHITVLLKKIIIIPKFHIRSPIFCRIFR